MSVLIENKKNIFSLTLVVVLFSALGGCSIFGGSKDEGAQKKIEAAEEVFEIGVNAYLWRATLDTLDFMPILQANHAGGTILTDWKTNPKNADERSKTDVHIVGKKLTADALRVSVHRQFKKGDQWVDVRSRPGAENQIVNAILIQARLLRRDNAPITN